jgi:hypothetical protein
MYGIKVLPTNDPYLETAETAMAALAKAGTPGAFLVDTLPICPSFPSRLLLNFESGSLAVKHAPEWIPGAGFRRKARIWRVATIEMTVAPFAGVKQALVSRSDPFLHDTPALL